MPGRERDFLRASFHVGPKSGVTNSKKIEKNTRPSRGVILCDLVAEKSWNLGYGSFLEIPFIEMTYHFKVLRLLGQMS
jgi:hypothetical protein